MSAYADQLLRRIEAIDTAAVDNRRRAEAYQQMASELRDVTGEATSPDGAVTVVAGTGGEVRRLRFTDQIRSIEPAALAASVMHTIAAARVAAARQQAEVVRRGLGDTELLDRVLDANERIFGDQRPADPGPPPRLAGTRPVAPPAPVAPATRAPESPHRRPEPVHHRPEPVQRPSEPVHRRPEPAYEDDYFQDFNVLQDGPGR